MSTKNRKPPRPNPLVPRGKRERRHVELLGGAAVGLVSVLVVSVFLVSSINRLLVGSNQYASVLAAVLVDLANGDRSQNSLQTLTVNPVLVAAAQAKADDMAAHSYFAHVSPQGVDPWHWFKQAGYNFDYAGENLAVDFSDSGAVNAAWMNSPTHRGNILDPHFTEIGIATAEGTYQGHPTTFVVQEFGAPSSSVTQRTVTEVTIPASAQETALAVSAPATVLGETVRPPVVKAPVPVKKPVATTPAPKKTDVLGSSVAIEVPSERPPLAPASQAATPRYAPWWGHLFTSPRYMLEYAYWGLALLVVLLLGFATGFEIHVHHTRKAVAAGVLLSFILVMFLAADTFVFTDPVLTQNASMAAAAGAAF